MTDDLLYAYVGNLEKSYDDAGVLHVRGLATDATLDLDQQRCDPTWLKSAMTGWAEWGNFREMHGSSAVGTLAGDLEQKGTGYIVEAAVIDPLAAKKVESGVYKGFSIGIKDHSLDKSASALEMAPKGIINGGEIIEISLVDRPANPSARFDGFTLVKMVDGNRQVGDGVQLEKSDGTPPIAIEVKADDELPCPTCQGTGQLLGDGGETIECPECGGDGTDEATVYPSLNGGADEEGRIDDKAAEPDETKAVLSAKAQNDLPDSDFAYIEPGGKKDDEGKTTPRSKRHFPIHDAAHVRNALARAPQSPFGKKALPKIKAAAKKFGIEVSKSAISDTLFALADLNKAAADGMDWKHDPETLGCVRDSLIQLITQELAEFTTGDDERFDVSQLVDTLNNFLSWWQDESSEGETPSPFAQGDTMSMIGLGVSPDLVKAASCDEATDDDKTALRADVLKALGLEDYENIKTALVASEEKAASLTERLAKVEAMAAPKAIHLRASQMQQSRANEADTLQAEGERLKAAGMAWTDTETRTAYLAKADECFAKAARIRDTYQLERE